MPIEYRTLLNYEVDLTTLSRGFDMRLHKRKVVVPDAPTVVVYCHPRGSTLKEEVIAGPRSDVVRRLRARGYSVAS